MVRSGGGKATEKLIGPARQMPTRPLVCELAAVLSRPEIDELGAAT